MRATCAAAAIFCFLSVSATAKTKPVKLIVRTDPATGITTVFPSGALARSGLFTSWDIQPREAFDAKGKRSIELLVEVSLLVNGEQYHAFYGQVSRMPLRLPRRLWSRFRLLELFRYRRRAFAFHRALAALTAIWDRFRRLSFLALAWPPLSPPRRPKATACGFLGCSSGWYFGA